MDLFQYPGCSTPKRTLQDRILTVAEMAEVELRHQLQQKLEERDRELEERDRTIETLKETLRNVTEVAEPDRKPQRSGDWTILSVY